MTADNKALNDEGRALWNQKAAFWDALHGDEGNRFHRELVSPAVERLLALRPGERVLDIACGSGMLARRLAALGARVTAVDFSEALIALAQQRQAAAPIHYQVADATDEAALVALGAGQYDAVVCTMALMDMPDIAPLCRAARQLLASGGRFVVATAHPAFNSCNPIFSAEQADIDGELRVTHAVKISQYLEVPPVKAVGAPNEPSAHYYYHRPLGALLGEIFAAGFVLNGLEEPAFSAQPGETPKALSWLSLPQIPPLLAARFVVAAGG
jgi:2-polyprenyl-3-methyl-5-hydroxy-6-metoxy-1,4-benzoquinol methylase